MGRPWLRLLKASLHVVQGLLDNIRLLRDHLAGLHQLDGEAPLLFGHLPVHPAEVIARGHCGGAKGPAHRCSEADPRAVLDGGLVVGLGAVEGQRFLLGLGPGSIDEAAPRSRPDLRRAQPPVSAWVELTRLAEAVLVEDQDVDVGQRPRHAVADEVLGGEQDCVLAENLVPPQDPASHGDDALADQDHPFLHRDRLVLAVPLRDEGPDDLQQRVLLQIRRPVHFGREGPGDRRLQDHLALQADGDVGVQQVLLLVKLSQVLRHEHVLAQLEPQRPGQIPLVHEHIHLVHALLEPCVVGIELRQQGNH
mmetsp:Transcript_85555/g.237100  ORF Transcript_85555/g.237100 Transcript_85555/m.237100 type:complete len:308 (-) Transcript_85555:1099-2022(-)